MRSRSQFTVSALVLGLGVLLVPAAQASYTLWHSPLNYSTTDDLEARPYYNTSALTLFPLPQVSGTFDIQFMLTLPSNVEIEAVTVCYRGFTTQNWISRIELDQMLGPTSATTIHEELVHLDDVTDACHTSPVGNLPADGTVTLTLELQFNDPYDSILIGAIGIRVSEPSSGADAAPFPPNGSMLALRQNQPNPFTPPTFIEYSLAQDEHVSVEVLDVTGRVIRTLCRGQQPAGDYCLTWDGADGQGKDMPAGTYYYVVQTRGELDSRGMILLR